jgi:hypothetical protein
VNLLEALFFVGALAVTLAATALVWGALKRRGGSDAAGAALSSGDFGAALALGEGAGAPRREALAAATAARHLLLFDRAAAIVGRLLAEDPDDADALVERALLDIWGANQQAEEWLNAVLSRRPDLAEPLALHSAFSALRRGDSALARRRFEDIAPALETKLRTDIGPGDGLFADWFLEAAALWRAGGESARAAWAETEYARSAPQSRLRDLL